MQGMLALRRESGLVLGVTVDAEGTLHAIYKPLLVVAGEGATGYVLWRADPDGVIRRFSEALAHDGGAVGTLTGQMARRMGKAPRPGLVDYWRGPAFNYVPFTDVLTWYDRGDSTELARQFSGKPVLLGVVLPFEDRVRTPVGLWAAEPDLRSSPGVMLHAQALRNMLGDGLIRPVPVWLIACIASLMALLWFAGATALKALIAFTVASATIVLASTTAVMHGWYVPAGAALCAAAIAVGGRLMFETTLRMRDHVRLRQAFGGSVSPQVLAEIMAGRLLPSVAGARSHIAVLFVDVRDFTARAEGIAPETVIGLLNRYFEVVISATHGHGGTVDKFMGDGIIAFFGAPQSMPEPAAAAVATGKQILNRMNHLNTELRRESVQPIEISIGIHCGEAVVGHIGSAARYEYTAIGDVVNVASRLEALTKEVGFALVCTRDVINELESPAGFVELGSRPIRGHSPVELFGYERRRAARDVAGAGMEVERASSRRARASDHPAAESVR
jgi:adenylate cyclase